MSLFGSAFDPKADRDKFITQLASEICKSGKSIQQCFQQLDSNSDGKVSIDEFRSLAKKVNSSLSEFDVLVLFSELASIGFSDFDAALTKAKICTALEKAPDISLWIQIVGQIDSSGKSVRECFDMIDANKDGKVSQEELWSLMQKIMTTMSADDFRFAFALVDTSSDGSITCFQFQVAIEATRAKMATVGISSGSTCSPVGQARIVKVKRHVYNARGGAPPYRGSYITATDVVELDANRSLQDQKNNIFPSSGFGAGLSSGDLAVFPADQEAPRRWEFPSPGGQALDGQLGKSVGEIVTDKMALVVLMPMLGFD